MNTVRVRRLPTITSPSITGYCYRLRQIPGVWEHVGALVYGVYLLHCDVTSRDGIAQASRPLFTLGLGGIGNGLPLSLRCIAQVHVCLRLVLSLARRSCSLSSHPYGGARGRSYCESCLETPSARQRSWSSFSGKDIDWGAFIVGLSSLLMDYAVNLIGKVLLL